MYNIKMSVLHSTENFCRAWNNFETFTINSNDTNNMTIVEYLIYVDKQLEKFNAKNEWDSEWLYFVSEEDVTVFILEWA